MITCRNLDMQAGVRAGVFHLLHVFRCQTSVSGGARHGQTVAASALEQHACDSYAAAMTRLDGAYRILPQVEEVSFQAPVSIGDLLRFQSHVAHTARRPEDPTLVCTGGDTTFTCPQKHLCAGVLLGDCSCKWPASMHKFPSMLQGRVHVEIVASVMKPEVASSKVRESPA